MIKDILKRISHIIPDKMHISILYYVKMHKRMNWKNPQTFNEKLQWLKIYDRKPEYTQMVDKYEAKKYVAGIIGEEYIIPTLGVWNSFDEIDFDSLPDQFVLKCTHDSGGVIICRDKSNLDRCSARAKLEQSLRQNYFWWGREWPYKDVKPRIIAEKYMVDESGYDLKDYKFFVFDGVMKAMFIATDRNAATETCFNFYDCDFNVLPFTNGHPNSEHVLQKPKEYEKMIQLAEELGKGLPQVRIDFYNINGKIFFGEITFFHWSGMMPFEPEEWDYTLGSWIKLPEKNEACPE